MRAEVSALTPTPVTNARCVAMTSLVHFPTYRLLTAQGGAACAPHLTGLRFVYADLNFGTMMHLMQLFREKKAVPMLISLSLSGNTNAGYGVGLTFSSQTRLRVLDVQDMGMTDGDMKAMAGALGGAGLFEKLEVPVFSLNKDLTDRGLTTLALGVKTAGLPGRPMVVGGGVPSFRSHKRSPVI